MKFYKRGYTQGVFDMFHVGHLNIFKRAKEHCEFLVVGVNSDEMTYERKQKYPVIGLYDRIAIVESIRYVDFAVELTNMDHYVNALQNDCDVVFVGDDWKGTEKWNLLEKRLKPHNIDVVYFPYTSHVSSTTLRDKESVE